MLCRFAVVRLGWIAGLLLALSGWGAAPVGAQSFGQALSFDGADDYATLDWFIPGLTFSVEMWVNPAAEGDLDAQAFLGKHPSSGSGNEFLLGYYGDSLHVELHGHRVRAAGQYAGWQHLAVVVTQVTTSSQVTLYRDGVLVAQEVVPVLFFPTGRFDGKPWVLGQEYDSGATSDFFQGQIDEVRIWTDARTEEEIRAYQYRPLTGTEQGLFAYWALDEGSGTVLADDAGSRDGTLIDGTWVPSSVPAPALAHDALRATEGNYENHVELTWDRASRDEALLSLDRTPETLTFDGTGYATLGTNWSANTLTVEAWVNPAVQSSLNNQLFVGKHEGDGSNQFLLGYYNDSLQVRLRNHTLHAAGMRAGWQHLAVTLEAVPFDSTEITLYRDGVRLLRETVHAVMIPDEDNRAWVLGQDWDGNSTSDFFTGEIDDVRLWTSVRTRAEIRAGMFTEPTGDEAGLQGAWRFASTGEAILDATGGTEGALVGATRTPTQRLAVLASDVTYYADAAAYPNRVYRYCLNASEAGGANLGTSCATGRRSLSQPVSAEATSGTLTGTVALGWVDRSSIETGFQIVREQYHAATGQPISGTSTVLATVDANQTFFEDDTVGNGRLYEYCVQAVTDHAGQAAFSGATCAFGWAAAVLPPIALAASDGQYPDGVHLSWVDQVAAGEPGNEARFILLRGPDADNLAVLDSVAADISTFIDATATSGTAYVYGVRAKSAAGVTSIMVTDAGNVGLLPPPLDVAASDGTRDDAVVLTWGDPFGADSPWLPIDPLEDRGFRVLRDGALLAEVGGNQTTYTDEAAGAGVVATYCVESLSTASGGAVASASVCDDGRRSFVLAVADVAATDDDFEDRIVVSWTSPGTTPSLFKIYRIVGTDTTLIKTTSANNLSFTDTAVASGATRTYCVAATTAQGDTSAWGDAVPGTCDTGRRTLLPPTDFAASDNDDEAAVALTWIDASQAEAGYHLDRRPVGETTFTRLDTLRANANSYTDRTGASGVIYAYRVVPFDAYGDGGGPTDEGHRTLRAPTNLAASDATSETEITLTWEDHSLAEAGYRLYRDDTAIHETAERITRYTDAAAAVGTSYTYAVVAFDAYGESAAAADDGATALLAPQAFNASDDYADDVQLVWIDASALNTGYALTRDGVALVTLAAEATSYTDTTATAGTVHRYCLTATAGATGTSATVCDDGLSGTEADGSTGTGEAAGLLTKLTPSDADAGDAHFGVAVSIDETYAVAGFTSEDEAGTNAGAAYTYAFNTDEGRWEETSKIVPGDYVNAAGETVTVNATTGTVLYGWSVDVAGRWMIVGAPRAAPNGVTAPNVFNEPIGAAYVYKRTIDGAWESVVGFPTSPSADDGAGFGHAVAISDTWAVIGIADHCGVVSSDCGDRKGAVSFYQRQADDTWDFAELIGGTLTGDRLGTDLDLAGDYVIAGGEDQVVYYQRTGDDWAALRTLTLEATELSRASAVAIGAAWSAIGDFALQEVHIYDKTGATLQQVLTAPDGTTEFGRSVALEEDRLIVGATSHAAFIYERDGNGFWRLVEKLASGSPNDEFGFDVALSGTVGMVAAEGDDERGEEAGAFYLLDTITDVEASDSRFEAQVEVTWSDFATSETGFLITREGLSVVVPPNTERYNDFDAPPGELLTYCVSALGANDRASAPVCDLGLRPANGSISGRVATQQGAGVADVEVCPVATGEDALPLRSALLLDGAGGYVEVPSTSTLDVGETFTLEAWIYAEDGYVAPGETKAHLISRWGGGFGVDTASYLLFLTEDGKLGLSTHNGSATTSVTSTAILPAEQWVHVAATVAAQGDAGGAALLYLDGASVAFTGDESLVVPRNSVQNLNFGRESDTNGGKLFPGRLDEIRIWDTVRTPDAISAARSTPLTGSEAGLIGYWPIQEGQGTGVADLTENGNHGLLKGGTYWSEAAAPLVVCTTTDDAGNYTLTDVRYGSSTAFSLIPALGTRTFDPPVRAITLGLNTPVQNQVDFVDNSAFTVAGLVTFEGTTCPVPDVSFWVGEADSDDRTYLSQSEADGSYRLAVNPSRRAADGMLIPRVIEPRFGAGIDAHAFAPAETALVVEGDQFAVNFVDQQTRLLSGFVGGGCNRDLGTVTVEIFTENGCFTQKVTVEDGSFLVNLPPQPYLVQVVDVTTTAGIDRADVLAYFDALGPQPVDLTTANDTLDLVYRAPMQVQIAGLPAPPAMCGTASGGFEYQDANGNLIRSFAADVPVLAQGPTPINLAITVNEVYGDAADPSNLCPVEDATVTLFDELGDRAATPIALVTDATGTAVLAETSSLGDEGAAYVTFANTPNVFEGRTVDGVDRSFQKSLTAIAQVEGREAVTATEWVLVTGRRTKTGTFVSGATGEIPLMVLYDPPGDGSYTSLTQESTVCTSINDVTVEEPTLGFSFKAYVGFSFVSGTPFFLTGSVNSAQSEFQFLVKTSFSQEAGIDICTSTEEGFSTADDATHVGPDGDVFVGASLNLLFAESDLLEENACALTLDQVPTVGGDSENPFKSTYVYTRKHIRDTILPQLRTLLDEGITEIDPDKEDPLLVSEVIENWENQLAESDKARAEAEVKENRSFDAGASYSYSFSHDTTRTTATSWRAGFESENKIFSVFNWAGVGADQRTIIKFELSDGQDFSESNGETETFAYVLADDDLGDYFSVDVLEPEAAFTPTPAFTLRSGRSSYPWEPGTQPRDSVLLALNPPAQYDLPPDEAATFTLSLTNASPSGEAREYHLRSVTTANPGGAILKANGASIHKGLSFFVDPGQTYEVTLEAARGANRYLYEDLAVMAYPPGEYDIWGDGGNLVLSDTVFFDVGFQAPCSDLALLRPEAFWRLRAGEDSLRATLTGFDLTRRYAGDVSRLGLEYRAAQTPDWLPAFDISVDRVGPVEADSLSAEATSYEHTWAFAAPDGTYELRAFTQCGTHTTAPTTYSDVFTGFVDRTPPQPFGPAQPADQELALGEVIAVTFDEPIDCASVQDAGDYANVALHYVNEADGTLGDALPIEASCNQSSLILTPLVPDADLENRELRARLRTDVLDAQGTPQQVTDLNGNGLAAPLAWDFRVRRSAVAWSPANLDVVLTRSFGTQVTTSLLNGRVHPVAYTLPDTLFLARYDTTGTATGDTLKLTPSRTEGEIVSQGASFLQFDIPDTLGIGSYEGTYAAAIEEVSGADTVSLGHTAFHLGVEVVCRPPIELFPSHLNLDENNLANSLAASLLNPQQFAYNMTLTTLVYINGAQSIDPDDFVVAVVTDVNSPRLDVRGYGQVTEVVPGLFLVYMQIYSNRESGESIQLLVWDDDDCTLHVDTTPTLAFRSDLILGDGLNPMVLQAPRNPFAPGTHLEAGWSWFSVNTDAPDSTVTGMLAGLQASSGDIVKSQTAFSLYDEGSNTWVGTLAHLVPGEAYLIHLAQSGTLLTQGTATEVTTPIAIEQGWNWIGYHPQQILPTPTALAGLSFTPQTGDLIKSQSGFAQYAEGIGWLGSLTVLRPGGGYLLYTTQAGTLTYPAGTTSVESPTAARPAVANRPGVAEAGGEDAPVRKTEDARDVGPGKAELVTTAAEAAVVAAHGPDWHVAPQDFEQTMTLTATIQRGGHAVEAPLQIGVFAGDDLRGTARLGYVPELDAYRAFVLVHGPASPEAAEPLAVRIWDPEQQAEVGVLEDFAFAPNTAVGTPAQPLVLSLGARVAEARADLPATYALEANYPNPFNPSTTIRYALPEQTHVRLVVYDVLGREVATLRDEVQTAGYQELRFDARHLASGVYFYQLEAGSFSQVRRMMLVK